MDNLEVDKLTVVVDHRVNNLVVDIVTVVGLVVDLVVGLVVDHRVNNLVVDTMTVVDLVVDSVVVDYLMAVEVVDQSVDNVDKYSVLDYMNYF